MSGECWKNLQQGFFPSFEEGEPRRSNKCHATLTHRRGGGGQTAFVIQELSDLPGRADSKVARHLFDRRVHPSSKEGKVDSRPIFLHGKPS